jgi:acetyl esterase/lipase
VSALAAASQGPIVVRLRGGGYCHARSTPFDDSMTLFPRLFVLASLLALAPMPSAAEDFRRTSDVVYGRKLGMALTLEVFEPARPNGRGVVSVISGAWNSSLEGIDLQALKPFLERGYTVFAVLHGSSPRFRIQEAVADVDRAVRFVRHNAAKYGVDPSRLGITGTSSGCQLALMTALRGDSGAPHAVDPVQREPNAVGAVACFFGPTDFLNYRGPGDDAVGQGLLARFRPAFGDDASTPEGRRHLGLAISPIYFVSPRTPPVLLLHGTADPLVPIYQSEQFVKRCEEAGVNARLIRREGQGHGWAGMYDDIGLFAEWFDEHLGKAASAR